MAVQTKQDLQHVVIVGGGFGGLETARRLKRANVRVTIVDRHNYHLFQPLLYQVATGGLSPANIATPLRAIVRRQANCEVLLAEVKDFDIPGKRLILADDELKYDTLVLAAGATHSYFGNDHWAALAPGLKTVADAAEIRRRIYVAFEAAEREQDPEIQRAMLTFVIVGGGPTGVELAGALSEIAHHTLKYDFRHINPEDARIIVVQSPSHVLAHYPEELSKRAEDKIRSLNIEVLTNTKVHEIADDHVRLISDQVETVIPARTVLWAAGVKANSLGNKLATAVGLTPDRAGRVPVRDTLQVEGHDELFVIGDISTCMDESGKPYPGLASVAVQQGGYVAKAITAMSENRPIAKRFYYNDRGTMATIGRGAAAALIGKYQFCGFFAWLMWLFIHLMLIAQFQNRMLILMQWCWSFFSFNRSNRTILGEQPVVIVHHDQDSAMHEDTANA